MKIGFAYNAKDDMAGRVGFVRSDDALEEYDSSDTIMALADSLRRAGSVQMLGWGPEMLRALMRDGRPDIVFNIAEGLGGAGREAQVPAVLEMLGIPYTGSDSHTLAVALDKDISKRVVERAGVDCPGGFLVRPGQSIEGVVNGRRTPGQSIVKPAQEGSSKGIRQTSLCSGHDEIVARVKEIHELYGQPALVEEYIEGRELTVALMGYPLKVVGIMEIVPTVPTPGWIYGLEAKRNWRTAVKFVPVNLPEVGAAALRACEALGCRDIARVDFRLRDRVEDPFDSRRLEPYLFFLEVNPLPGLSPTSDFPIVAKMAGLSYDDIVNGVLSAARARYGI